LWWNCCSSSQRRKRERRALATADEVQEGETFEGEDFVMGGETRNVKRGRGGVRGGGGKNRNSKGGQQKKQKNQRGRNLEDAEEAEPVPTSVLEQQQRRSLNVTPDPPKIGDVKFCGPKANQVFVCEQSLRCLLEIEGDCWEQFLDTELEKAFPTPASGTPTDTKKKSKSPLGTLLISEKYWLPSPFADKQYDEIPKHIASSNPPKNIITVTLSTVQLPPGAHDVKWCGAEFCVSIGTMAVKGIRVFVEHTGALPNGDAGQLAAFPDGDLFKDDFKDDAGLFKYPEYSLDKSIEIKPRPGPFATLQPLMWNAKLLGAATSDLVKSAELHPQYVFANDRRLRVDKTAPILSYSSGQKITIDHVYEFGTPVGVSRLLILDTEGNVLDTSRRATIETSFSWKCAPGAIASFAKGRNLVDVEITVDRAFPGKKIIIISEQ